MIGYLGIAVITTSCGKVDPNQSQDLACNPVIPLVVISGMFLAISITLLKPIILDKIRRKNELRKQNKNKKVKK